MQFLRRNTNKGFTEVMVEMVGREASYRLEVSCMVHLYGPKDKVKELVEALCADELL